MSAGYILLGQSDLDALLHMGLLYPQNSRRPTSYKVW